MEIAVPKMNLDAPMDTTAIPVPVIEASSAVPALSWRSTTAGAMLVARLDGKDVAGISGPWDGSYALTWWTHPGRHQLELFDSQSAARYAVEAWARRVRTYAPHPVVAQMLESWDEEGREVTPGGLEDDAPAPPSVWRRWWARLAPSRVRRSEWSSLGDALNLC